MIDYTLFEKIKGVFSLIFSSPLFLILLFGIILMVTDIKFVSKTSKSTKVIYAIVSIVIVGLLLQQYFDSFLNILDIIGKNIVALIYFPTVLEYMLILLISLVIILISIFNKRINKKVKIINSFVFITNMFLFFLILDQIQKSKVDLSNKISVYSNDYLMILFEISIFIFFLWVIGLIMYKIIKILTNRNVIPFYEEPEMPKTIEELKNNIKAPESKVEYILLEKKNDNDMFTLEEYKQMRALLETMKNNKKES